MTNLIVISSETNIENETGIINDLFHSGMRLFHLRKPGFTLEQQRTFLEGIEKQFHDKISVHQHYETVNEFGLKYCHVKESNREGHADPESFRDDSASQFFNSKSTETLKQVQDDTLIEQEYSWRNLGDTLRETKKSTSFHDYGDLQFQSHLWDYCFLSPVFDSISKPGYKSNFKSDFTIAGDLNQRVFALGGITKENIEEVFKKEFYGAAVLGSVWKEPTNAVKNFKELEARCTQNVHTY